MQPPNPKSPRLEALSRSWGHCWPLRDWIPGLCFLLPLPCPVTPLAVMPTPFSQFLPGLQQRPPTLISILLLQLLLPRSSLVPPLPHYPSSSLAGEPSPGASELVSCLCLLPATVVCMPLASPLQVPAHLPSLDTCLFLVPSPTDPRHFCLPLPSRQVPSTLAIWLTQPISLPSLDLVSSDLPASSYSRTPAPDHGAACASRSLTPHSSMALQGPRLLCRILPPAPFLANACFLPARFNLHPLQYPLTCQVTGSSSLPLHNPAEPAQAELGLRLWCANSLSVVDETLSSRRPEPQSSRPRLPVPGASQRRGPDENKAVKQMVLEAAAPQQGGSTAGSLPSLIETSF
ncbi:PREDICTED: proline-rich protein 36-like isoform X2 [Cercocebus atys]|uniref:proline-rich protein 36-like isoform X2 n=1 Tax=Cercocebus atys TaxID=9531 RepID=UPI0005F42645|nr:PREDICTED: proline-rich protein 36-like isoform X2 [Cercocebus atys]